MLKLNIEEKKSSTSSSETDKDLSDEDPNLRNDRRMIKKKRKSDAFIERRNQIQSNLANRMDFQQKQREEDDRLRHRIANMSEEKAEALRALQRIDNMSEEKAEALRVSRRIENMSEEKAEALRESRRIENMSEIKKKDVFQKWDYYNPCLHCNKVSNNIAIIILST